MDELLPKVWTVPDSQNILQLLPLHLSCQSQDQLLNLVGDLEGG